jgi:hypothetical protein
MFFGLSDSRICKQVATRTKIRPIFKHIGKVLSSNDLRFEGASETLRGRSCFAAIKVLSHCDRASFALRLNLYRNAAKALSHRERGSIALPEGLNRKSRRQKCLPDGRFVARSTHFCPSAFSKMSLQVDGFLLIYLG